MSPKKRKGARSHSKKASNITKTILEYVRGKRYIPSTLSELTKQLDIPPIHKKLFKELLDDLVDKGKISFKSKKYTKKTEEDLKTGIINVLPKGFGFVRVNEGPDVFIPRQSLKGAVDGDTVEVQVSHQVSPKGPEGNIIGIVKRSRTHIAGTITQKMTGHYIAFSPLLGVEKDLKVRSKVPLNEGDRVICKVITWSNEDKLVEGETIRHLGNISDPSIDIQAAIEEFELPKKFTSETIEEAKNYGKEVQKDPQRKDVTDLEVVTIDPTNAKDFDDAISLTKDKKGNFFLGVHIADVAHYVKPDSHLDKEAYLRCNSTYFPGKVIPMLPEELSNELCSLKPNVPRLTQSVFAQFNPEGDLINYSIERCMIHSKNRFTYEEAFQVLENKLSSPYEPLLKRMVELCHLLKKKRFARGSIDFAIASHVVIVDDKGIPERIEKIEYDITHQMIEEFMLKANEIVATHLCNNNLPMIFRIHEEPDAESFQEFFKYARALGFQLSQKPSRRDVQQLFIDAKGSPYFPQLSISFIRSMKLAAYSTANIGHYGLALENYSHFTSPIRRYIDLVIQRLLFNELPEDFDLESTAKACSEKERVSFRAESSVTTLKKLRLAACFFKEDPKRIYEATISKIKPFALFFDIPLFDLEGNVHVSELGDDYFEYTPISMSFKGTHTGKTYESGQKIWVQIESINFILLQSQWCLSGITKKNKKRKRG